MSSDSRESLNHSDPPLFVLVLILVLISSLQSRKSWIQSWYQDTRLEHLNSSLDIKTLISKVAIPVFISRLNFQYHNIKFKWFCSQSSCQNSWIIDLCANIDTGPARQNILNLVQVYKFCYSPYVINTPV